MLIIVISSRCGTSEIIFNVAEESRPTQQFLDGGLSLDAPHRLCQGLLIVGRQGKDLHSQRCLGLFMPEEVYRRTWPLTQDDVTASLMEGCELGHFPHFDGRRGWGRGGTARCEGWWGHSSYSTWHRWSWCWCCPFRDSIWCIRSAFMKKYIAHILASINVLLFIAKS